MDRSTDWFSHLRQRYNLTQRQVAEALGVTDQTVSNWERRHVDPKLTHAQWESLCQLLRCSFEELTMAIKDIENVSKVRG
jgi:DNA-binding XRE family transcriptional regulator